MRSRTLANDVTDLQLDATRTAQQAPGDGYAKLLCGRTLSGRYRIDSVLDRGGMGVVYKGWDCAEGQAVAVKVAAASSHAPAVAEAVSKRLAREGTAGSMTNDSRVVAALASGVDSATGLRFLVMELLDGENLAVHLRGHRATLWEWLKFGLDAFDALIACHDAGIVHRDVKPSNLFVAFNRATQERSIRLIDLGIAQLPPADRTLTHLTRYGHPPATPKYASPEQIRGESPLSPTSDVYSLALVLYEMLAGSLPTERPQRGYSLPALETGIEEVDSELEMLFDLALAPRPESRASARILRSQILAVIEIALAPFAEALARYGYSLEERDPGVEDTAGPAVDWSTWFREPGGTRLLMNWDADGVRLRMKYERPVERALETDFIEAFNRGSRVTRFVSIDASEDPFWKGYGDLWLTTLYPCLYSGASFYSLLRAFHRDIKTADSIWYGFMYESAQAAYGETFLTGEGDEDMEDFEGLDGM